jgi:SMC interacting uncharacterized protein involved in chromosome segregation
MKKRMNWKKISSDQIESIGSLRDQICYLTNHFRTLKSDIDMFKQYSDGMLRDYDKFNTACLKTICRLDEMLAVDPTPTDPSSKNVEYQGEHGN